MAQHDYSFAVLDINLGNETSQKVAKPLDAVALERAILETRRKG